MTQEGKILTNRDKFTTQWAFNSGDQSTSMPHPFNSG
jgi:hypothetical protein